MNMRGILTENKDQLKNCLRKVSIPENIEYKKLKSLSTEAKEKLSEIKLYNWSSLKSFWRDT